MNSYPPELLAQLAPVMFVAGLDAPATAATAQSPTTPTTPRSQQDPFAVLTVRLREALLAQRQVAIWQPDKAKSFQIIPVDKAVRFPPRKLVPQDDSQFSAAHSPLSPLTPSSPLHPDGLIAPIWIRKHTTLVPSVFVMFLRVYEYPPHTPRSPLDAPDPDRERDRELEERRRDSELAADVALRKKSTNERNIKLTVVLMASRRMLDDPSLDSRLTYIRRQSGLDSRAALFVLSPVSQAELGDFVKSLQQALYEPALEYYTAHSKRVRRKRNRHSQAVSSYPTPHTPLGTAGLGRPLRPEGWTVRYEYKMACFAEFRGEDDIALKLHYQDAYGMLVIMFGSTAILPPRTKRWAEAKVLADCINIKVAKLYLYNNEHALALSHHNTHIRKFGDFSRGWGIGEETFEFWSWIARQHRILAELLEHGTQSKLVIPDHRPINHTLAASQRASVVVPTSALEMEAMRTMGINPSHALQHPGYYYYMAAKCTEARRERFLAAAEAEASQKAPSNPSPGFTNEKKVDHLIIILELYTKAYELFKKYASANAQNQNQGRLTLWIAYRIGQTYYESGKFDMAVRFFERIAKSYRRENWGLLLRPLLATWYACAQQLGDVELSIKLLVEMLGVEESDDPASLEEDLLAVLKSSVPSTPDPEPMVVELPESQPMFDSSVVFWAPEVKVGEPAAFQLCLTAPTNTTIASLPFSSLDIHFSGNLPPVVVRSISESTPHPVQRVDLGHISSFGATESAAANLRWQPGASIVFTGNLSSDIPASFKACYLVLTLVEGPWTIQIPFDPSGRRGSNLPAARWLSSIDPPRFIPIAREEFASLSIRHRPHNILMSLSHKSPAYLNEDYPIIIEVTNADDRDLEVTADVLLQPTEVDGTENSIVLEDERSSSLIKGVNFGILQPGVSVVKTLYLVSSGAAGDRMVDVSIQSTALTEHQPENPELQDMTETLQTLVVPTLDAIKVDFGVVYKRAVNAQTGVADLRTYDHDFWDDADGGEAIVTARMECSGPWALEVASIKLDRQDNEHARVLEASIDADNDIPSDYLTGDEFCSVCRISMDLGEDLDLEESAIVGPGRYEVNWRRILGSGDRGPLSTSIFSLPPLRPAIDGIIALLDVPPTAKLHIPLSLTIIIRNRHPSRSANVTIQLEPDPMDSFVVAGLRSGRVPIMLPGGEERVTWRLIPIECGYVQVPRIKIVDKRRAIASAQGLREEAETEGEVVKIIDVRLNRTREQKIGGRVSVESVHDGDGRLGTVLVLP
ncbi:Gryzun, putative trafficking through golgi-domain-containing protein [Mycena crocata]|nr:Gryzun, putative trafficking through golgi-domain-containing protein [Mycena crocata]